VLYRQRISLSAKLIVVGESGYSGAGGMTLRQERLNGAERRYDAC